MHMQFLIDHIKKVLTTYEGHPPLHLFLKDYFKRFPKLGSRDRRALSQAVFSYYRYNGRPFSGARPIEDIMRGLKACGHDGPLFSRLFPGWEDMPMPGPPDPGPSLPAFSEGIDPQEWRSSLLSQPDLFIRLTGKDQAASLQRLSAHGLPVEVIDRPWGNGNVARGLRLPNGSAVQDCLPPDAYIVQDLSSQESIYALLGLAGPVKNVWDVCSGAGGKSLLLKSLLPPFYLLATDVRKSILANLTKRFSLYKIDKYETGVANATESAALDLKLKGKEFDLILCDVPCSGSGTWARNPERLAFFDARKELPFFEKTQASIAINAARYLAPGGLLAYITCSVFRSENEDAVARITAGSDLACVHRSVIKGLDIGADSMYLALFRKK